LRCRSGLSVVTKECQGLNKVLHTTECQGLNKILRTACCTSGKIGPQAGPGLALKLVGHGC
jgi:hypothetical protein